MFQEFYFTAANCHRKFIWNFPDIKSIVVIHDISGGKRGGSLGEKRAGGVREAGKRGREAGKRGREAGKRGREAGKRGREAGKRGREAGKKGREAGKRGREAGFPTWRETAEIGNIVQYFNSKKSKVARTNKIKGSYEPTREEEMLLRAGLQSPF